MTPIPITAHGGKLVSSAISVLSKLTSVPSFFPTTFASFFTFCPITAILPGPVEGAAPVTCSGGAVLF